MVDTIDRGRESFARRAWADAFAQLSAAEGDSHLGLEVEAFADSVRHPRSELGDIEGVGHCRAEPGQELEL